MRSTGEVMGIAPTFGESYAKSQIAAFGALPKSGTVFISLSDKDKDSGISAARELQLMGFNLVATIGTATLLGSEGIKATSVRKHSDGTGPLGEKTIVEQMVSGQIDLVINTPVGRGTRQDGWVIRTTAVQRSIPCITTVAGFNAAVEGIKAIRNSELKVKSLQEWLVEIAN
jgi:carbamoyl-phosphate synthase large subunit